MSATAVEEFETVIGLECHVELSTRTKMFCGCRNAFGAEPNTAVCPVCLGLPGTLPVPNARAIEFIQRIGLALDCRVAEHSLFHRKNYFYPDMPKDFQISQYDLPICISGHLDVAVDGETRRIGITRVHMEEDTGKTSHAGATGRIAEADYALIDYNRAGVPLVECVSEPGMRSAEEARAYLTELRATLQSLDVSDVRMEEGSLRCDANVSVRPRGSSELGVKVEVKNLNSIRSLHAAVRYEEERQRQALRDGTPIVQETRHWDENKQLTSTLRSKEFAFDYRYFPEPDLPALEPTPQEVEGIRRRLPELPRARRERLSTTEGLGEDQARVLGDSADLSYAFDRVRAKLKDVPARTVANWVINEPSPDIRSEVGAIADVVRLVSDGSISALAGKEVLAEVRVSGRTASEIVEEKGLKQVSDASELGAVIDEVIAENPGPAEQFRGGKEGIIGFLVGQVMKKTGGSANPKVAQDLLRERLTS
ncbi:MAG: Asp-tRNA(Asn)/Glu-tRNA(Gln) amidotransferase subunit GatB [Actinomycetota bacterium]